jgi:tripartite-type tricarboxylate transporter receptor subunit TctC
MMPSFHLSRRPGLLALVLGLFALTVLLPTVSQAQTDYPRKPVRLLLGFPPGGGSDIVARLVAQPLGELLGQGVVVDNKPGAGGNIATELLTKAAPDGYTLILLPSGHASGAAMKKSLPFHPVKDFAWISTITTYPLALAVAPGSPIQSFADLLQRARAEPGKYSYSSSGVGTAPHLIGEWILDAAGVNITHIPFRGGTGPMTELLAGRVDVMVDTMTLVASLLKDQRVRALAVTSPAGASNLSGVPAVADLLSGVVFESWLGIAAPAGTPPDIVDKLNQSLRKVLEQAAVRQKLIDLGGSPRASSPDEFQTRVERDIENLRKVVALRRMELE